MSLVINARGDLNVPTEIWSIILNLSVNGESSAQRKITIFVWTAVSTYFRKLMKEIAQNIRAADTAKNDLTGGTADNVGILAARSGNLEMVKFIEQFRPLNQTDLIGAAQFGSIEVLKYYLDKGLHLDDAEICEEAAFERHMDFIRFAISRGAKASARLIAILARGTDGLDLIREVRSQGCPWDFQAVEQAIYYGEVEVLQYLVENGCPVMQVVGERGNPDHFSPEKFIEIKEYATVIAAQHLSIRCLQYLMEHGAPWPHDIIKESLIFKRRMDTDIFAAVIKCLHGFGCEWNTKVSSYAATFGNLELLKFVQENQLQ